MWAYALSGPRRFERVEVAGHDPDALADDEVLVKVLAGAVCGSDLGAYAGLGLVTAQPGRPYSIGYPGYPMHEVLGEVLASRNPLFAKGAHVVGWARDCDAISDSLVTTGDRLAEVDVDLDPAVAILIQTLACVIFAVDKIGDVEGQRCAVLGQGPIGTLFAHVLKSRGASHVTGVDLVDRRDFAADFGVDECVTGSSGLWAAQLAEADRPSVIVEAIGHQHVTLGDAVDAVAPDGRIYYFGIPELQPIAFDLMKFLRKNLLLQAGATTERHQALANAREHLKSHPFLMERYITNVFDVAEVNAAYEMASHPSAGRMKVAVRMA